MLGKINKHIREQINKNLANHLAYHQWKYKKKSKDAFIQLDIKEFYSSITEDILKNAIALAKVFISINDSDPRIVKHCRKFLLFSKEEVWKEMSTTSCFVVTLGSYDDSEICELVGFYILSNLETIIHKNEMGLYRDNELLILRSANGQKREKTRKDIKIF